MNCTYGKIDEYLDIIDEYVHNHNPKMVFITDLSFKIDHLEKLHLISKKYLGCTFIFIDHHPIDEEYSFLRTKNLKIVISEKASATKLTYKYLIAKYNAVFDKEMDDYVNWVNAYDIWLKDTPEFKVGIVYNELFWNYGSEYYFSKFRNSQVLETKDKNRYKSLIKEKNTFYNKLEETNKIMKFDNDILIVFLDDFQTFVTLDYPDYKIYAIINSYGKASVRLANMDEKQKTSIRKCFLTEIDDLDYVISIGGHLSAFGITLNSKEPNILVDLAKNILHTADRSLEEIGIR